MTRAAMRLSESRILGFLGACEPESQSRKRSRRTAPYLEHILGRDSILPSKPSYDHYTGKPLGDAIEASLCFSSTFEAGYSYTPNTTVLQGGQ